MHENHPKPRGVSPLPVWSRALLIWLAFTVRVLSLLAQGVWRDEVDQWRFARVPWSEMMANFTRPGWNGPLYSPLLRGWILVAGDSVYAMRFLSVVWGVLLVALITVLGRRLFGDRVAGVAGLLAAFSPYMVWYAQEIKMYTWVPMLVVLALYALDQACSRPHIGWWIVVLVATSLAFYSHVLAALLVGVLGVWFFLHPRRDRRAWVGGGLVLVGLTVPYVPLLRWQTALAMVSRETGFPNYSLGQMIAALANGWSAGVSQGAWGGTVPVLVMIGFFSVLAILGLLILTTTRRGRVAGQVLAWLAMPLVVVWFVSLRGPIFTDRYLIWSAPAFYLFVAVGVVWLAQHLGSVGALLIVPLLVIDGHGLYAQAVSPIKPQFAPLVEVVEERRQPWDILLFQIPYNRHVYGFYVQGEMGAWAEAPYTNWREPDGSYRVDADEIGRQVRRLVAGYDRVWLVYSEATMWDDRELVRGWLEENYSLAEVWRYTGVELYLFTRPPRSG